jgi:hypothetical protein
MFNEFVAVARGSFVEFIFYVGLSVAIGWIGQFAGALTMAGGAA